MSTSDTKKEKCGGLLCPNKKNKEGVDETPSLISQPLKKAIITLLLWFIFHVSV